MRKDRRRHRREVQPAGKESAAAIEQATPGERFPRHRVGPLEGQGVACLVDHPHGDEIAKHLLQLLARRRRTPRVIGGLQVEDRRVADRPPTRLVGNAVRGTVGGPQRDMPTLEPRPRIAACGPERMLEAVSGIARQAGVPCQVSLETPMACGIGICFTCVARIRQPDGSWDYKRTCVDGPIFDAEQIAW